MNLKGILIIIDIDYLLVLFFLKVMVVDSIVKEVDNEEIVDFIEVYFIFMEFRFLLMKDFRLKVNFLLEKLYFFF